MRLLVLVLAVSMLSVVLPVLSVRASQIVFPPGSGVFNVVTDGGIDNTGKTDVREPLQKLLDESGRRLQVLYFPDGTYLLSGQLRMKLDRSRTPESHSHGPWIYGQSRSGTILRLVDNTWPTPRYRTVPDENGKWEKAIDEQCVLNTGDATNTTFNKQVRNLTINTGRGNAGAIGLQFNTSNTGILSDVDIVSEDGASHIGLALAGVENGPGQMRNVRIRGFDVGIYSMTDYVYGSSNITVEGARTAGLINRGLIAAENFNIEVSGDGPAVRNLGHGVLVVLGGVFRGAASHRVAVENDKGMLSLRDARAEGFAEVVTNAGATVDEMTTGRITGLFYEGKRSLRLPIVHAPQVPFETDFTRWTNPMDHGAVGDGKADDTQAVRAALNAPGKTHVVFPFKRTFRVSGPLVVGPEVVRIIGTHGSMPAVHEHPDAKLHIREGSSPVVIVQGFSAMAPIVVETDRTVVLDSVQIRVIRPQLARTDPNRKPIPPREYFLPVGYDLRGGGDVFVNNSMASIRLDNPKARLFVRHYNNEWGGGAWYPPLDINAGTAWVLGWKSENLKHRARVGQQGVLEMIGFNNYEVGIRGGKDGDWPIFSVEGGQLSVSMMVQRGAFGNQNLVWETRGGQTRKLTMGNNPGGKNIGLYVGFDPQQTTTPTTPTAESAQR